MDTEQHLLDSDGRPPSLVFIKNTERVDLDKKNTSDLLTCMNFSPTMVENRKIIWGMAPKGFTPMV